MHVHTLKKHATKADLVSNANAPCPRIDPKSNQEIPRKSVNGYLPVQVQGNLATSGKFRIRERSGSQGFLSLRRSPGER